MRGFGLILDDKSLKPKFIYESNNNHKDGVLISFYENGIIKSFRTNSMESLSSQYFEFYPNGVLKVSGNKVFGAYDGYVYYFNDKGEIEKRVLYKNGQIVQN